ncbi:MAG: ribbon-helix-helix protein, CopG family [Desulfuromonadaceae bacterium]|nr:ribbon-helix-helix protein, CopG family [Desulfuromonadaceae bacterium]
MTNDKRKPMGKSGRKPRYNVISIRISEESRRHLETLMEYNRKSVSDIMREALKFYVTRE